MILKSLKEKSNQKFVEQALLNREIIPTNGKVETVGVLLNHSEFCKYDKLNTFIDALGISDSKRKIFTAAWASLIL